jgi:hypothetical protein
VFLNTLLNVASKKLRVLFGLRLDGKTFAKIPDKFVLGGFFKSLLAKLEKENFIQLHQNMKKLRWFYFKHFDMSMILFSWTCSERSYIRLSWTRSTQRHRQDLSVLATFANYVAK